jgi:hypothetical protein
LSVSALKIINYKEATVPEEELPELMRTLLAAGFEITRVDRKPNYIALALSRPDAFSKGVKYLMAYAGDGLISSADIEALKKLSAREGSSLVIVSSNQNSLEKSAVVLTKSKLFSLVGGIVSSALPLEPEYGSYLKILAKNELPQSLMGEPDDLFEAYVHAGFQFILRGRVLRYGQSRRFEAVSDGLVLGKNALLVLYDAKAASDHYEITRTTIRQFADYTRQFHTRYEEYVGRVHAFAVVSYAFQELSVLTDRSNELYAECGVQLVCITAESMAQMVSLFADRPIYRSVVDWKSIFVAPVLNFTKVKEIVDARKRDRVVGE